MYNDFHIQGAYVGITTGLILTLWVGIGAAIYKPPHLGHIPPPMTMVDCPYKIKELTSAAEPVPNVEDK